MTIPTPTLDQIRIDGGTQMRVEINQEAVADYAEAMIGGAVFPPMVVFFDGAEYWLGDGFHRYHAYRKAGGDIIPIIKTVPGTLRETRLFAMSAADKNGMRHTLADKRKVAETLLTDDEWSQWSDRVIASKAQLSPTTIGSMRLSLSKLDSEKKQDTTRTYVDRHGNTGEMNVRGQKQGAGKKITPTGGADAKPKGGKKGKPKSEPKEDPKLKAKLAEAEKKLAEAKEHAAAAEKKAAERADEDLELLNAAKKQIEDQSLHIRNLEATIQADDAKAHHLSMIIRMEHAERRAQELMGDASQSDKRAKFWQHHLARVGKAIGVTDLDNIAASVEAIMRRVKAKDPSLLEEPAAKGNGAVKNRRAAA